MTAKRAYRHPAADDFYLQVGGPHDAAVILGSGQCATRKTGHHRLYQQRR